MPQRNILDGCLWIDLAHFCRPPKLSARADAHFSTGPCSILTCVTILLYVITANCSTIAFISPRQPSSTREANQEMADIQTDLHSDRMPANLENDVKDLKNIIVSCPASVIASLGPADLPASLTGVRQPTPKLNTIPAELISLVGAWLDNRSLAKLARTDTYLHLLLGPRLRERAAPLVRLPTAVLVCIFALAYNIADDESFSHSPRLAMTCQNLYARLLNKVYRLMLVIDGEYVYLASYYMLRGRTNVSTLLRLFEAGLDELLDENEGRIWLW